MILASEALGRVSTRKKDTNKDASLLPLHLIVQEDLYKGLDDEGNYSYSALVDSLVTYNFISQSVVDKLRLKAVKAGRKKNRKKMLLPMTSVNGESLRATTVIQQIVWIYDSTETRQRHAINFIIADIVDFDLILSIMKF